MTVAFGAVLTVKLIRKRFSMNWLRFRARSKIAKISATTKIFMIAKDLIPEMGTRSFAIMNGGRKAGEFRSTMIVAAGESLIRHGIVPRR